MVFVIEELPNILVIKIRDSIGHFKIMEPNLIL
jgi:hypothetical protein